MEISGSQLFVSLFFIHGTVGTGILAWWFLRQKSQTLKDFGLGLAGYSLGLAAWTAAVLIQPEDLRPLVLLGVVPFLLAHIAYARAASVKLPAKASTLSLVTLALIVTTFIARTFFYPSDPYFSDNNLLYFGLEAVPVALYIATISVSFLPAILAVAAEIKDTALKSTISIGFLVLFVNSIILVSAQDDSLLMLNGGVMSAAILILWTKVLLHSQAQPVVTARAKPTRKAVKKPAKKR